MLYELLASMPMFACAFLSVALATSLHNRHNPARAVLLVWSMVCTALYACHFLFFQHAEALLPYADSLYAACNLTVYPLYLIYISRLTCERLDRRWLIPLPVAVAMGLLILLTYARMTPAETLDFIGRHLYHQADSGTKPEGLVLLQTRVHDLCRLLFAAEVIATLFLGSRCIQRYNNLIEERYADVENKQMHHIGIILRLLILTSLASMLCNLMGRHFFADSLWLVLPSVLFTALLMAIGLAGLNQQFDIQDVMRDEAAESGGSVQETIPAPAPPVNAPAAALEAKRTEEAEGKAATTASDEATATTPAKSPTPSLARRFVSVVEEEQLFLQPDLKLQDVCIHLATNRTYLLNALSQELQMTFSEYINRKRIAYAKRLMTTHPELTRSDIALRSGYTVISSFYRNWNLYADETQNHPS